MDSNVQEGCRVAAGESDAETAETSGQGTGSRESTPSGADDIDIPAYQYDVAEGEDSMEVLRELLQGAGHRR